MANGQYIGVNGVARKVVSPYIGVDGVARKVTAGYIGVDGVARQFLKSGNPVSVFVSAVDYPYTYVEINGTQYYEKTSSIEVMTGDTILFHLDNLSYNYNGNNGLKIDGETVISETKDISTYSWTVPEGITSIAIDLPYPAFAVTSAKPLFEFYISSSCFVAEEGMTWLDYADSNFNGRTTKVVISGSNVSFAGGYITKDGTNVNANDLIIENCIYGIDV